MTMTPRKHAALAARIRTDLDLLERCEHVSVEEFMAIRASVEYDLSVGFDGLGYSNLIYPQTLRDFGFTPEQTLAERKEFCRISRVEITPSHDEEMLGEMLQDGADNTLSFEWQWRVGEHARFLNDKVWYPFFVTLTVDPKYHDPEEVFGVGATAVRDYFKTLARVSMRECGVPRSERDKQSDRDYLQHFFTIEHGKSGVHHHAHGILWFREIPDSWKVDPNFGQPLAVNRRCPPLETYWKYCVPDQRPANYYWFLGCPWQRLGHRVPVDDTGKGFTMLAPEMGGFYCAKYMGKEDKQWKHRVKATRNLGLNRLLLSLKRAPSKYLEQMVAILPTYAHQTIQTTEISVPIRLTKRLSRLELYCREYASMNLTDLLSSKPKPYGAMLSSLAKTRPWLLASEERYEWLLSVLPPAPKEFCEDTWFEALAFFQDEGFGSFHTETVEGIGGYSA
ncbi:hypothetical protein [uncultured Tateyamaria sp.]|uniref:hypothetical protein n=1 Tax=uncultured Tateyamaria sp. TaxID=455651 RepID=UPI0026336380|nr:hypothetical protein [uncultured Tateyamaria sp.]